MAKNSQDLAAAAADITTEDLGEKVRVHALAKTLGIASAELVQVLNEQGIEGKRATSTLPRTQVEEVLGALRTAAAPTKPPATTASASRSRARSTATKSAAKTAVKAEPKTAVKTTAKAEPKTASTTAKTAAAKSTAKEVTKAEPKKAVVKKTATKTAAKAATKTVSTKAATKTAARAVTTASANAEKAEAGAEGSGSVEATVMTAPAQNAVTTAPKKVAAKKTAQKATKTGTKTGTKTTAKVGAQSTAKRTTKATAAKGTSRKAALKKSTANSVQSDTPQFLAPDVTVPDPTVDTAPPALTQTEQEGRSAQTVGKKTATVTSRAPRRGRKATSTRAGARKQDAVSGAISDRSSSTGDAEHPDNTVDTGATVDALIDRIADSVETTDTTVSPAETPTRAEAVTRPRRRVVRRVGSRSIASDGVPGRAGAVERHRVSHTASSGAAGEDGGQSIPAISVNAASSASSAGSSPLTSEGTGATEGTGVTGVTGAAKNVESAATAESPEDQPGHQSGRRSRRRGRRGRGRGRGEQDAQHTTSQTQEYAASTTDSTDAHEYSGSEAENHSGTHVESSGEGRRDQWGHGSHDAHSAPEDVLPVLTEGSEVVEEPVKLKGSTRLESKRRWRQEQGNDRRKVVSKAEFLARRENVDRAMIVRDSQRSDHSGTTTQVGITEDGMLVEHFVTSETQSSIIGNIYLGRVQNVLASMEAAFIDIGTGRNAVLYAGEVDWRSAHLHTRSRRIESALKPGDQVLVQVIKDPLGHKGARLTNRISFAGRYLVYVPGGKTQGISRKLPEAERRRLKEILQRVVPEDGGTIIRTAAEGVSEELIAEDVNRLHERWEDIQVREQKARSRKGSHPVTMYEEPNMLVKVIRDIFNEDFDELVVDGGKSWSVVRDYVHRMAPDLESRVVRYHPEDHDGEDVFAHRQLDEQLAKALSQKVWLPSGGYLIIDPTEAMTVIDVNTGSFVGSGGNLEETVTRNNLEAAEEIVRQMRLRDLGGMIVVDFIDMVLPENRDLVLRRLSEYLGRDRTRHKVSEVTSLGLVQMTRKRLGTGLLETFSTTCPTCDGRGVIIHADPVEHEAEEDIQRPLHSQHSQHSQHRQHSASGHSERRDHGNRTERQQARAQQETRRRHERAREEVHAEASEERERQGLDQHRSGQHQDSAEATYTRNGSGGRGRTRRGESRDRPREETKRELREENRDESRSGRHVESWTVSGTVSGTDSRDGAESAESSDNRRGRRRVIRRVEQPTTATAGAGHSADDVAAIAARAVVRAGAEDPDEPSGADYVPAEWHQSAGSVVSRKRRPAPSSADTVEDADSRPVAAVDRRGRRRVRRVINPATDGAQTVRGGRTGAGGVTSGRPVDSATGAPEGAPEGTLEGTPEQGGAAQPERTEVESYAEAKAEFDSSPRRRRRTRGRSRSDIAPRPEDFGAAPEPGSERDSETGAGHGAKTGAGNAARTRKSSGTDARRGVTDAKDDHPAPEVPASRRGRRRVVRSSR